MGNSIVYIIIATHDNKTTPRYTHSNTRLVINDITRHDEIKAATDLI